MRKWVTLAVVAVATVVIGGGVFAYRLTERQRLERLHYEREEPLLVVANVAQSPVRLFRSQTSVGNAEVLPGLKGSQIWLPTGEYFVEAEQRGQRFFYPVTVLGYRSAPDSEGMLSLTIRAAPTESLPVSPESFAVIPSCPCVIGDRRNPRQPHYVWLQGFVMHRFEVSNVEYRAFLRSARGYGEGDNRTDSGKLWRAKWAS